MPIAQRSDLRRNRHPSEGQGPLPRDPSPVPEVVVDGERGSIPGSHNGSGWLGEDGFGRVSAGDRDAFARDEGA
jgi:hypothetical protein